MRTDSEDFKSQIGFCLNLNTSGWMYMDPVCFKLARENGWSEISS